MLNMSHLAGSSAFFSSAVECDPLSAFVQTIKPISWCLFMTSHRSLQPLPFTRPAFDIPFLSWTETLLNSELDSDCQRMKHQLTTEGNCSNVFQGNKFAYWNLQGCHNIFCSSLVTAASEYYSALINDISRKNTLSTSPRIRLFFFMWTEAAQDPGNLPQPHGPREPPQQSNSALNPLVDMQE